MKSNRRRKPDRPKTAHPAAPFDFVASYNAAVATAQIGRLEDAARQFGMIARSVPGSAIVQTSHGKVLMDLGRFDEALGCYDQALRSEPGHAGALNDRAAVLLRLNRHQDALDSLDAMPAALARSGPILYNRAVALDRVGRQEDALRALDQAIVAQPDLFDALFFRGIILYRIGRTEAALDAYTAALAGAPERADFNNNRGTVLLNVGRLPEALACFDKAVAIAPNFIEALINRGRTLGKLGRPEEDLACQEQALALAPGFSMALIGRGFALHALKRHHEALASLEAALGIDPKQVSAWQERAIVLLALGRREDAVISLDAGLELAPDSADLHNNRGEILQMLSRFDEAARAFGRLLELDPGFDYADGKLVGSRLSCCDWADLDRAVASLTAGVRAGRAVAKPFQLLQVTHSPGDLLTCAVLFAGQNYHWSGQPWLPPDPRNGRRLRVAYVSGDFQRHATAFLMAELFEAQDHAKFETIAVSFGADDGSATRLRLVSAFDRFIDVQGMTDAAVIAMLREMRIDIAIDLKGFTNGARPTIFKARVAPVQVSFLGYPCTWGHDCMDYLIADRHLIPAGQDVFYTESIVYLPDTYQPNDRHRAIADLVLTRADVGLPAAGFVFCCFNSNFKILPEVFDIWVRLLLRTEGSVLWLLETNEAAVANLRREAAARGLAPDRLVFAGLAEPAFHLVRQRLADLFLDTLPCNAHTTTSDALWVGLPVLTRAGQTFAGRVAASLLHAAGLPELITHSAGEYEALALKIAATPSLLAALKARLEANRLTCALFDTERFCRHLEAAFQGMHERYRRNEPPACFAVGGDDEIMPTNVAPPG